MDAANLRTPDDARKLWCATSNQFCRADGCGHWRWSYICEYKPGVTITFSVDHTKGQCGLIHA